jgi:hypothetical protein
MMNKTKRYRGMSATELAEATKEYDVEGAEPKFLSAPPELRAAERRIRKGRGRPLIGKGAQRVSVTVERALLHEANKFAKSRNMTRSELIAIGLRMAIRGKRRSA